MVGSFTRGVRRESLRNGFALASASSKPKRGVDPRRATRETTFFYSFFLEAKNDTLLLHRPLLSVSRGDVKRVCHLWHLPVHPDVSNECLHHARNRIRKQLLPTLRFFFNRQLDGTLLQFTKLLSTEQLHVEYLSQRLFSSICLPKRGYIAFDVAGLKPLPLAIGRHMVKRGLERYATRSLHFSHVDHLFYSVEKKRLQSRPRFGFAEAEARPGDDRLCLLPLEPEQRHLFRDKKEGKVDHHTIDDAMERSDTSSPSSHHSSSSRGGGSALRSVIAPRGLASHGAGSDKSRFASLRLRRSRCRSEGEATVFTWYMEALKRRKGGGDGTCYPIGLDASPCKSDHGASTSKKLVPPLEGGLPSITPGRRNGCLIPTRKAMELLFWNDEPSISS